MRSTSMARNDLAAGSLARSSRDVAGKNPVQTVRDLVEVCRAASPAARTTTFIQRRERFRRYESSSTMNLRFWNEH